MSIWLVLAGLVAIVLLLVWYYFYSRKIVNQAEYDVFREQMGVIKEKVDDIMRAYSEALANIQRVRKEYPASTLRSYRGRLWETGHPSFVAFSPYGEDGKKPAAEMIAAQPMVQNWPDSLPEAAQVMENSAAVIAELLRVTPVEFRKDNKAYWTQLQNIRMQSFTPYNVIQIGVNLIPTLDACKRDVEYIWKHDLKPLLVKIEKLKDERQPLLTTEIIDAFTTKLHEANLKYSWLADPKATAISEDWLILANCLLSEILMFSSLKYFLESVSEKHPVMQADIARLRRFGLYIPVEMQL